MNDVLKGIDEDVKFDAAAADALIATVTAAASLVEGQAGSRASWITTGSKDFKGHFADLFKTNAATARADSTELVARLREVATGARRLKEEASKEQKRRETARQWKQDRDDRNILEKGWDKAFGGDDDTPPVGPAASPVTLAVSASRNAPRQTPSPGSGGAGGGGTSSARPADLHSFATSSAAANQVVRPKVTKSKSDLAHFVSTCHWGSLQADGVMAGFSKWLEANDEDVQWANVVGNAFAAAGGEGAVSTLSDSALAATLQAAGVRSSRQDLVIDPPSAYGHPPTTGYAVDPVNTSTGNFLETESDLGFAGACGALAVRRTYNSLNSQSGAFGLGWSSLCETGLVTDDEGAYVTLADGRKITFPRLGAGWDRAVGENYWLARTETGLRMSGNEGSTWDFAASGLLQEFASGPGTTVALEWSGTRLVAVAHERGRRIELSWTGEDAAARICGLRASDGRTVAYAYDDQGRLVAAASGLGTRRYGWNEGGLIQTVTGADGVVEAENVYDDQGRVTQQRTAHGRLTRLAYLAGRVTVVSDQDGTRSNTWIADERGRLVGVVDADEQRQSMAYDKHGNLVMVTERDEALTVNEYDDRGRVVRRVLPTGAELSWTWDEQDRVATVSVSGDSVEDVSTTSFRYLGSERQPSVILDAEGGLSEMTWDNGLMTKIIDPTGVVVRFAYDAHGDLVATTDAMGNSARLERDSSGRVVAATTPSGNATTFAYDDVSGLLVQRVDPDGATWRFEHTDAGRLCATIDPLGSRTEMEYGAGGEITKTVDPLGRAISRNFDDLGNLASVELPDGSAWTFANDAMSRVRAITDPAGQVWKREYDVNGDLVSATDPAGEKRTLNTDRTSGTAEVTDGPMTSGIKVDRLGRLVASETPDGASVLTRYDRCGRPVELIDANGGLTTIGRDAGGRVASVTRPGGGRLAYEYDQCGRPSVVVDELGGRSTVVYDADGRVVEQAQPAGDVASLHYDVCGRLIKQRVPGVGTSTWTYDLAGRVIQGRDPRFGRRIFRYDAAGQLVEAVNGNGGVTRWEYDANGRAVVIIDPDGGRTQREFDAVNHLVAETDPLGRTTRAGYDASGNQLWQTSPDGERTEWVYDAAGKIASVTVDGQLASTITRDIRGRRVQITEFGRAEDGTGYESAHELVWDASGKLISRQRDGRGLSWSYDADGRMVSRTGPGGDVTRFERDPNGRVQKVTHPLLGSASFTYDAAGRPVTAEAGGIRQTWTHTDGFVSVHTVGDARASSETLIDRDGVGRVVSVNRDGVHTTFDYDQACQLIEASTAAPDGSRVAKWRYDAAGRLVMETLDGMVRELSYDAAGQLVSSGEFDGRVVAYSYDGSGRRTSASATDGTTREFIWSKRGWLSGVVDKDSSGETSRATTVVDALGELSRLNDAEVFFDTSDDYAPAVVQFGDDAVIATGAFTGIGQSWDAPGWRGVRSDPTDATDPWGDAATGISPSGAVGFAGLEWLGARVFDPAARGFLSVDPLDTIVGSGWSGNPYAYAGNDPMHATDPTGFRPATDADLKAYADAHQSWASHTGEWMKDNWEYVAGGAMIIAGGVLIATGVGGPAGMMLISAGADTIIQKATTGHVNWGEVAVSGAMGAWGGAGAATRLGAKTALQRAVVGGMISGGGSGAVGSGYSYMSGPGPHTVSGLLEASGKGTAMGVVTGGAGGAAGHGLETVALRRLSNQHVIPGATDTILGHHPGYITKAEARGASYFDVGNKWDDVVRSGRDPWTLNEHFLDGRIANGDRILMSTPKGDIRPGSYLEREVNHLQDNGYKWVNQWSLHPG